jgi:hypothetical protein
VGSLLTLGALVFVAVILFAFLMKKNSPGGSSAPAFYAPSQPATKGEHDDAIAVMSEWYREAKRKEFEEGVLKDVVEKFSKKAV